MSKIGQKLGVLAMMALMMDNGSSRVNDLRPKDIDVKPKPPVIPKGCKQYFFFDNGRYCGYECSGIVFRCVASSEKNAIRKFNKWKSI